MTGTFTVPTPSGEGASSGWVGIDGDTCQTALLQTGIDFFSSGGEVSYQGMRLPSRVKFHLNTCPTAWFEWIPDYAHNFDDFDISAGDVITLTVVADSTTTGEATIENVTTGQTVNQQLSSEYALCEQDAEWIVEDYEENGQLVPFDNFGTVTFSSTSASTSSGNVDPAGAVVWDIEQNGQVLTSSSVSDSGVTISYTGNQ